jgi:hypothetical protein
LRVKNNFSVGVAQPSTSTTITLAPGVPLDALIVSCVALVVLTVIAGWLLDLDWPTMRTTILIAFALPWVVIAGGALFRVGAWAVPQIEKIIRVDLNQDGAIGPPASTPTRFVPVRGGSMGNLADLVDAGGGAVERADAIAFVRTAVVTSDWSRRAWTGQRLPSGRVCDADYHAALMRFLTTFDVVKDYGERKKGTAVTSNGDEALRLCGLV